MVLLGLNIHIDNNLNADTVLHMYLVIQIDTHSMV